MNAPNDTVAGLVKALENLLANLAEGDFISETRLDEARTALSAYRAQQSDGWIEWGGGEQPVADDVRVDIRLPNGIDMSGDPASFWHWDHKRPPEDRILAYRVVAS